jgi:hypothetical protein
MNIKRISLFSFLTCFLFVGFFSTCIKNAQAAVQLQTLRPTSNNLGLVGLWSFDGSDITDKVYDRSGNADDATFVGGATSSAKVLGRIGQALRFDGVDDYVTAADPGSGVLDFGTGDFSYSIWVNAASTLTGTTYVFAKGINGTGYDVSFVTDTVIRVTITDGTHISTKQFNSITPGGWHNIVVVAPRSDSTGPFLYYDGVRQSCTGSCGTDFTTVGNVSNSNAITIGQRGAENPGNYFQGSVDDVRIYNRALSAADVKKLYNSGSAKANKSNAGALSSGLTGYWPFDGSDVTDKIYDRSGNANDATFVGGATSTSKVIGRIGQGFKFTNGVNQYVLTPLTPSGTVRTISAWVYNNGVSGGAEEHVAEYAPLQLWIDSSDVLRFYSGSVYTATVPSVPRNTWTHVVAVCSSVGHFIYVNGQLASESNNASTCSTASGPLYIGRWAGGGATGNEVFNGTIDDVRVYDRALSAAEINQLYKEGNSKAQASQNGKLTSGLVGMWSFDGLDVTDKIYDRSGSGFNATFVGGATSSAKVAGKMGQGLRFDGVDDYALSASPVTWPTLDYTISVWAKKMGVGGHGDGRQIMFGDGQSNYLEMCFSGQPMFSIETTSNQYLVQGGGSCADIGVWTHYVGTWNGSVGRLYINGVKVSADVSTTGTPIRQNSFVFGTYQAGNIQADAILDDARIYNRALSASEVMQLYNLGR